jgi:hypothetical protein
MHGSCVRCHRQFVQENPAQYPPRFAECRQCHRDVKNDYLRELEPYVLNAGGF